MKKSLPIFLLAFLFTASPAIAQVSSDNEEQVVKMNADQSRYDFVEGQVIVKFKDEKTIRVNASRGMYRSTSLSNLNAVLQKYGTEEMEHLLPSEDASRTLSRSRAFGGEVIAEKNLSQLYRIKLSDKHAREALQMVEELNTIDEVEYAEPNYIFHTLDNATIDGFSGGNPNAASQWYLEDYGVTTLWNKPLINRTRPVIAILDTGVDLTHPDLMDNLWTNKQEAQGERGYDNDGNGFKNDVHGWDFINNTPNIRDYNTHGTHVAGIAAAANNNIGIVGANPMALIMPVTVMQSDGSGDAATIIKGINYAVANGATILNLSLGTYANSKALRQALENAYQKAVIVAAAGNDHRCINSNHNPSPCYGAAPMFPAAYSFVLGVQATTQSGALAPFTNYDDDGQSFSSVTTAQDSDGFNYELKAPGVDMVSTIPGGRYGQLNGTSMATPLVAGAISALKMVKKYDSQEILWGDLLHSENIAQAYATTKRPAELDLMKVMYRERKELSELSEEDYSGDGEIDAGETVSLYPVIRTTFGAASNIKMKLEMGDEFEDAFLVEILTPGWVDFGLHLDAYGKGVALNPMKLKVAAGVADGRHIKMKFTAKCDETNTIYEGHFTMTVNNMVKINGLISEDKTLTADHVYYVNDNIGIMEGVTLTIEPGTRLEFAAGMGISSFGKLIAKGTPEKPIVFTRHGGEGPWAGIKSHKSTGEHYHEACLYTNADSTLFTLLPTEQTPNRINYLHKGLYYGAEDESPNKEFYLSNYIEGWSSDMTSKRHLLTDPDYLTPAVLKMLDDWKSYCDKWPQQKTTEKKNYSWVYCYFFNWSTYDNPRDTISYCRIEGYNAGNYLYHPYIENCVIIPSTGYAWNLFDSLNGDRNNIMGSSDYCQGNNISKNLMFSNIVNNYLDFGNYASMAYDLPTYSQLNCNNYFNNFAKCNAEGKYYLKQYSLANNTSTPSVDKSTTPSYLGTSREDIIRPYIYEIGNAPNTYGSIDLSNMRTTPIAEAHGIVWKVVVNGKDAQDEYEDLAPLGVGKHKFEVYFNRPMNKAVAPQISFGVRDPWTQQVVDEDGSWNAEGTIYTAYKTINGKTKSDGVNRIYVRGAQDDEYFEIPYEKTRFNIMVNAAGSMATGFAAEPQLGRVKLTWDNSQNNFDDAMGFNVYRYSEDITKTLPRYYDSEKGQWIDARVVPDTIRINKTILDVSETTYTDYDVKPGTTYTYYYKVLSTDLKEYDISNEVAVTPLTATKGDANGSGNVDVVDVVTTVNYIVGADPKPFIFEAADMNADLYVDVLDVVGIVNKVLNPGISSVQTMDAVAEAVYTIEDGVLYIETPIALSGVQVQLSTDEVERTFFPAQTLKGFERASRWLTDNDFRLLAYNIGSRQIQPGKHALLTVGDAEITSLRLSDRLGNLVKAVYGGSSDGTTGIKDAMGSKIMTQEGIYNLNGQKLSGTDNAGKLQHGVYIINGKKIVK